MLVVTLKLTFPHFTHQSTISVFQFKMIFFENAKIRLPLCMYANMYRVENGADKIMKFGDFAYLP